MDEAVEDGVGDGGIADDFVPAVDRHLAGDDDGPGLVVVLDDLQEVSALVGVEGLGAPVVENEKIDAAIERSILACLPSPRASARAAKRRGMR